MNTNTKNINKELTNLFRKLDILPEDLEHFQNLLKTFNKTPLNLLPPLRESRYTKYIKPIIELDLHPHFFQNLFNPYFTLITFKTEKNINYMEDGEPDEIIFQIKLNSLEPLTTKTILGILLTMMISDCTDCCNALSYINYTPYGILGAGTVGRTYHS